MIAPFEALAAIPFHLLLLMFAGWGNRHQSDVEPRSEGTDGGESSRSELMQYTNLSGVTLTILQLARRTGRSAPRDDDPLAASGMEIILAVEVPTRPAGDSAADLPGLADSSV